MTKALLLTVSSLAAAFVGASGCADKVVKTTYQDEGQACVIPQTDPSISGGPEVEIRADEELLVHVLSDGCQSWCAKVKESSCSVFTDGSIIRVSSHAEVTEVIDSSEGCQEECRRVESPCPLGPLSPGSYTILHGNESQMIEVPGTYTCKPG